jgi:hypothetical protein
MMKIASNLLHLFPRGNNTMSCASYFLFVPITQFKKKEFQVESYLQAFKSTLCETIVGATLEWDKSVSDYPPKLNVEQFWSTRVGILC